jgi:putative membrane protein
MMGSGFGLGFPGLRIILVWVLIIGLVVALVRAFVSGSSGSSGGKRAPQLLDERLARGEIDQREYEEKRRLLP